MTITPLNNRVLVKLDKKETKTALGIILPQDDKTENTRGTVVSLAENVEGIKIGQVVMFSDSTGDDLKLDNDEYVMLDADDILAIIG